MDDEEDVLFQDFLYKLKVSKIRGIHRQVHERWKQKYFVLRHCTDRLLLQYYNKKPKSLSASRPRKQVILWPSYRVEKLFNAHNRAFALQLTAPECHICLSADEQVMVDIFVFILQTQIKFNDKLQNELVEVKTQSSDAFKQIGAKGAHCYLHVSPWGLTLCLKKSLAVLAQWPLKSVRYYESTGKGQFSIEAGKVAPMGEGHYVFFARPGMDNKLYDVVDNYIVNTLDRVKPQVRGTSEEIEAYIREYGCLQALTSLVPTHLTDEELAKRLHDNWNYVPSGRDSNKNEWIIKQGVSPESPDSSSGTRSPSISSNHSSITSSQPASPVTPPSSQRSFTSSTSSQPPSPVTPTLSQRSFTSSTSSQPPSPVVMTHHQPLPTPPKVHSLVQVEADDRPDGRVSGRPPPPPLRDGSAGKARLAKTSSHSSQQDCTDGHISSLVLDCHLQRHSNPVRVALQVSQDRVRQPYVKKQVSCDDYVNGNIHPNFSSVGKNAVQSQNSWSSVGSMEGYIDPTSLNSSYGSWEKQSALAVSEGEERGCLDEQVEDWLTSASCEDLSDHMRVVVFRPRDQLQSKQTSVPDAGLNSHEGISNNDPDFIPPPFGPIQQFRSSVDWEKEKTRDRSSSFDGKAKTFRGNRQGTGVSASPSIRQIRKLVSARSVGKENLCKSLSNPGFLNLGSKEHLYQLWTPPSKTVFSDKEEPARLSVQSKQKSRSLANLLPGPLRRYISREALTPSSPKSHPSPQDNYINTPASRTSINSNFQRFVSAECLKDMSHKGIYFTDQSRSFRKPKPIKANLTRLDNNSTVGKDNIPVDCEQSVSTVSTDTPLSLNKFESTEQNLPRLSSISIISNCEAGKDLNLDSTDTPLSLNKFESTEQNLPRLSSISIISNCEAGKDLNLDSENDVITRTSLTKGIETEMNPHSSRNMELPRRTLSQSSC